MVQAYSARYGHVCSRYAHPGLSLRRDTLSLATRPPRYESLRVPGKGVSPKDPTSQHLLQKHLQVPKARANRASDECTSADLYHPATAWNLYEWKMVLTPTTITGTRK